MTSGGLAAVSSSAFAALYSAFGKYDVVHIHAEGPAFFAWLPKMFGKRVVVTVHGIDSVQTLYDLEKALNLPECALVKRVNGQAEVDASQWSEEKEQVGRACRELEHALAANLTKSNLLKEQNAAAFDMSDIETITEAE